MIFQNENNHASSVEIVGYNIRFRSRSVNNLKGINVYPGQYKKQKMEVK